MINEEALEVLEYELGAIKAMMLEDIMVELLKDVEEGGELG